MSQAKGVGEWAFISSNETSVEDKRRNRQNARAHTARVIRQRQRIAKQGASTDDSLQSAAATASGPPPSSASQPSSSTSNALAVRGPRDISFGLVGRERDDGRQFTARRRGLHQPNASSGTAPTPIESTPLERSVSPTFGGLSVDTFGTESPGKALEAANYCMKIDWPNLLTPDEAAVWFASFCAHPVIFHGFVYASAVHQDILRNQISLSAKQGILAHKTKAFRLLGDLVSKQRTPAELELLLFAVMILWHYDLQDSQIRQEEVLHFSAYMPGANWLSVYGRTRGVESHAKALYDILNQLGGVQQLKMPGLAFAICCGELIAASIAFEKPELPLYWTAQPTASALFSILQITPPADVGGGFVSSVPGGLPTEATTVFEELSNVNVMMCLTRHCHLSDSHTRMLVDARNAVQYRLLSLPPWSKLSAVDQYGRFIAMYECCRVTAVLYPNAVIFPLPTNTGWHRLVVGQLRGLLQTASIWSNDALSLLIWSLTIGGIASFGSPDRRFFIDAIRNAVRDAGMSSWAEVECTVDRFMWSREACGIGASVLWNEVGVNSTVHSNR